MDNPALVLLSLIVFLPAVGALVLLLPISRIMGDETIKWFTFVITAIVFGLSLLLVIPGTPIEFRPALDSMQYTFSVPWIPSFDIYYFMGLDGISLPLVLLTTFVTMLSMAASWSVNKYVQAYCILFLLLETGVLGVFLSLDFFLFYVFWEVMLLPMYFLIGIWGGPKKEYAAIKFFLYTLLGGVLMLIALLMLYFNSDLGKLVRVSDLNLDTAQVRWNDLKLPDEVVQKLGRITILGQDRLRPHGAIRFARLDQPLGDGTHAVATLHINLEAAPQAKKTTVEYDLRTQTLLVHLAPQEDTAGHVLAALRKHIVDSGYLSDVLAVSLPQYGSEEVKVTAQDAISLPTPPTTPVHTFNLVALAALGQHTDCFPVWLQWWAFLLLFIGFIIKVPSVPVHTWLPDAHVEAPTPISMILAGILLKLGGYGIIRICYPICPVGGYQLAYFVCTLGVVSIIYGAFAALAQTDFKRLVAYSSVSHMGYVLLGLGVWSASAANGYTPDYWAMGVKAAMFQMIAHGISSPGMFFCVGVLYDRVHHRNLNEFGGIFGKMPIYTALAFGIFFAGLGLPGLCGFIGEFFSVLSSWRFDVLLAIIAASGVILTAGYILWCLQRVYLGAEYKGPHEEDLSPLTTREFLIASPMFALAIVFGVFPQLILGWMDKTVDRQVRELTVWSKAYDEGTLAISPEAAKPKPLAAAAAPASTAPARPASAPHSETAP